MLKVTTAISILAVVIGSTAVLAQQFVTTSTLDIHLNGACKDLTEVSVVMDGVEDDVFEAIGKGCHWTAVNPTGTFTITEPLFSLRLGNARTGCKHATVDKKDGRNVASLVFHCCGPAAHDVVIKTPRQIAVTYSRMMLLDKADPKSDKCYDRGASETGRSVILSLWYAEEALKFPVNARFNPKRPPPVETIRVHFGELDPRSMRPLLIFNDASVTRLLDPQNDTLSAEGILSAEREQRCQGKEAASPLCSANADDMERAHFKEIGLDHITVSVRK
jgi:hypothetical protein